MVSIKKLKFNNSILLIFFLFISLFSINLLFFTLDNNNIVIKNDTFFEINNLKLSGVSEKISIVGEQGWIDFKNAGNCTGSGSYLDPFVIKDLVIDGHGSGSGIKINLSRNYFFRIENCTIFNCSSGIDLISTDNGTLYNNDCSFNGIGIYLHCCTYRFTEEQYGCFNNTIIDNIANNNGYGIRLDSFAVGNLINNTANNNSFGIYHEGYPTIISGNTVNYNRIGLSLKAPGSNMGTSKNIAIDNKEYGIDIQAYGFNLTENFLVGSGIGLFSQSIERMSQISIDTTNFVNNKPIYYLINKTDIPPQNLEDAGQIFLINCTNILVKDVDVSNSSMGINIYDSNNITVLNAVSSNNNYGVYLQNTNNSFIINVTLINNKRGNFISGSHNTVEGNYIYSNMTTMDGLTFSVYDDYNKIINNEIIGCYRGIVFRFSSYNLIYGNILRDNFYGIYIMGGSEHNLFYENFFRGNTVEHTNGGSTTNKWNNTEIGNYWDNYTGIDADYNGIGDMPHIISQVPLTLDFLPIVDNLAPEITIVIPKNNSVYNLDAPSFIVIIKESFLHKTWYTLDGGLHNYTFIENGTINQEAWDALNFSQITIRFYAVDKVGSISFMDVIIVEKVPETELIPGYYLFMFFCVISIIGVILIVINRKSYSLEGLKKRY